MMKMLLRMTRLIENMTSMPRGRIGLVLLSVGLFFWILNISRLLGFLFIAVGGMLLYLMFQEED